MWIGLRKETSTLWKFTDGSTHDYNPGAHTSDGLGEPCFRIRNNPLIPVDVFCDRPQYRFPYVCQSQPLNLSGFVLYLIWTFPKCFHWNRWILGLILFIKWLFEPTTFSVRHQEGTFKLTQIHALRIDQIPWIQWSSHSFRQFSIAFV